MRAALAEAALAAETGDVPIGAVVLSSAGDVLGAGHNVRERDGDPTGHAEIVALRAAAAAVGEWRLTGCTLVVTLEPCTMCAGAAVLSRVERVVFAAYDEKAGAVGSLWDVVRDRRLNHRPEVIGGVLAAESTTLLERVLPHPPLISTARARPVTSPAVACPSGLRSTPRKRVWVQAHRGFKSHRHRRGASTVFEAASIDRKRPKAGRLSVDR